MTPEERARLRVAKADAPGPVLALLDALDAAERELDELEQRQRAEKLNDQLTERIADLEADPPGTVPERDHEIALAHLGNAEADVARLRAERRDLLTIHTKEGLLASEWLMRTATAFAEVARIKAKVEKADALATLIGYVATDDAMPLIGRLVVEGLRAALKAYEEMP